MPTTASNQESGYVTIIPEVTVSPASSSNRAPPPPPDAHEDIMAGILAIPPGR